MQGQTQKQREVADRMRRVAQAERARRQQAVWTPVAEAACVELLGEVLPEWVRRCVVDLGGFERLVGEIRAKVGRYGQTGRGLQWHDTCDVVTILRNVPRGIEVFRLLAGTVRQILATALGTDVGVIQDGSTDNTVYFTTEGWLFCLENVVFGGERRQVDVRFFRVDLHGPVPIKEFLRGVQACKPAEMTTGQVAGDAARFRADNLLQDLPRFTPVVPFRTAAPAGAFVWFVFDLPAGGMVTTLSGPVQLYQVCRDGACVEAAFALRASMDARSLEGKCAGFPRAARPGALQALYPIVRNLCNTDDHAFRLLLNLSRWKRGRVRRDELFEVNYRSRLRGVLPEFTVALAALLYPSRDEAYAADRRGEDVCVARTSKVEFTVTAVDAAFQLGVLQL